MATTANKIDTQWIYWNKANLRDLIAATSLVILLKLDSNHRFSSPCDLKVLWMTPKNNRAPLLCYIKLYASLQIHQWIQTGVTVGKRPIWIKIDIFLAMWPCNLTIDLKKTIEHLFHATSSFVHHFVAIGEFKLVLQSGNGRIWLKFDNFKSRVTLKFDRWPWNTIGHLSCATSSFGNHFVAIGEFKLELQSRNAQFGSNSMIFRAVWPRNLTDDLKIQ